MGVQNLYERLDRMAELGPMWIDVTWGAGGSSSSSNKTFEICRNALTYHGLDVMMHLTCTQQSVEEIDEVLDKCKEVGIRNILALRGDAPTQSSEWRACQGGFSHAVDLVRHIRGKYGDYFCIAVAGYPEGHLEAESIEEDLVHLKEKVDAGADLIITQLFYDTEVFFKFVAAVRKLGIQVPIFPGIMPIQSYSGFKKMTEFCKTKVPRAIADQLEQVKGDDQRVKDLGVEICVAMCSQIMSYGVDHTHSSGGLHFYTLNLESSVCRIIERLMMVDNHVATRVLPWRPSKASSRQEENVRPIFWRNRQKSFIQRTSSWDEFPNGRLGNQASAAYGDFELNFRSYSKETQEKVAADRRRMWGDHVPNGDHVRRVFTDFIKGEVKRLPWCTEPPTEETLFIQKQLIRLNQCNMLTINSQPRVNGALSTDPYVGWGPAGGFVYQKAYVEFFCPEGQLEQLIRGIEAEKYDSISYMAVTADGSKVRSNIPPQGQVNAVTWGVFPNSEIIQPTVVDVTSFMAWKDEAFALWNEWMDVYPEDDHQSRQVLNFIRQHYFLCTVVDNDFVAGDLFSKLTKICTPIPWETLRIENPSESDGHEVPEPSLAVIAEVYSPRPKPSDCSPRRDANDGITAFAPL
ncbi:Methylenetetrahydrofolate reductase, putative [Perkinsus marinus ATCC 50983]|uniref:Methylenetetrahydrofolate reductase, putative n=1 Tax=Perkinsus marinus (strain ATCC 50983 / TXsc) TaxID=423536 RepID=C5L500_PERM5|nr:Methylenetetrahydrofolate reductase, putative [Perkinsus marinus ATCC 50983]EER08220.1 Methylenetetrahydrofolate reductase, putative [Perkinsus marinus ATCC 50983]|eukprot:XP_002776404.1 Methylenetetrahydrofolate reductase, putative [Perkinsus marinus ATCC 50983]